MSDREALLAGIHADPDDDVARLVFADWLQEHGQEARAEFIRLQVRLSRLRPSDPVYPGLSRRAGRLFVEHAKEWRAGLPRPCGNERWLLFFLRGFPQTLHIRRGDPCEVLSRVLPEVPTLTGLSLEGASHNLRDEGTTALARTPGLDRLRRLELGNLGIGPTGAEALAGSPHVFRLTRLDLHANAIGLGGLLALAESPHLNSLTWLDVRGALWGEERRSALASSRLRSLKRRYGDEVFL